MGFSYGRNPDTGRMALACDHCPRVGGVRKRPCPARVRFASTRGPRGSLPLCGPYALCAPCHKALRPGLHKDCAATAARRQVEEDALQAKLDGGTPLVLAAWGDWHRDVPVGKVAVVFGGYQMPDSWYLIDAADYVGKVGGMGPADFPSATPFHKIN